MRGRESAHRRSASSRRVRTVVRLRRRRLTRNLVLLAAVGTLTGATFAYGGILPEQASSADDAANVSTALSTRLDRPPASRATVPTRTPTPTPTPTATPTPTPTTLSVPKTGSGKFLIATGKTAKPERSRIVQYRLEVERPLPFDAGQVAAEVHAALIEKRAWGADGKTGFQRVDDKSYDVRVLIASAATTDRLCLPLKTQGWKSCRVGDKVVLNADRWAFGVEDYAGHLDLYRIYLANHEMGHFLGHGHVGCPKPGAPAPVMMQQTKGLDGCKLNPWPYPKG